MKIDLRTGWAMELVRACHDVQGNPQLDGGLQIWPSFLTEDMVSSYLQTCCPGDRFIVTLPDNLENIITGIRPYNYIVVELDEDGNNQIILDDWMDEEIENNMLRWVDTLAGRSVENRQYYEFLVDYDIIADGTTPNQIMESLIGLFRNPNGYLQLTEEVMNVLYQNEEMEHPIQSFPYN